MATLIFVLTSYTRELNDDSNGFEAVWKWDHGAYTAIAFIVGALTSIVCGWIGMKVAVYANARCTVGACDSFHGWTKAFNTAFRAGGVMGFSLTGIALLSLYTLLCVLLTYFPDTLCIVIMKVLIEVLMVGV